MSDAHSYTILVASCQSITEGPTFCESKETLQDLLTSDIINVACVWRDTRSWGVYIRHQSLHHVSVEGRFNAYVGAHVSAC